MIAYASGKSRAGAGVQRSMTLYIFRSSKNPGIAAFSGSANGVGLPDKLAPWTAEETILPNRSLPHGLSRQSAESAVKTAGYALWRMKPDTAET
jgi:hypothetical protein